MNTGIHEPGGAKRGVALIIVLGLLSVLTLLAVAFAIAMRVERLAARNYTDGVRAEQLIQTCLARAMEDVNDSMINPKPVVYPFWENREPSDITEAMGSYVGAAGLPCTNILTGEATNVIPQSVWAQASDLVNRRYCQWTNVVITDGPRSVIYGRVAHLVVNTSGLMDANFVGGLARTASTSVAELDISALPEMASVLNFLSNRIDDVRFETLTELLALNTNKGPVEMNKPALTPPIQNLFVYSLDVGRDQYFTDRKNFGTPDASLDLKFNVNDVTNYYDPDPAKQLAIYRGAAFQAKYFQPLRTHLLNAGIDWKPDDIAWNIVNWIDKDRYPQGATDNPEFHSEGGEATPLVDEIYYQTKVSNSSNWVANPRLPGGGSWQNSQTTNGAEFLVELWYPFAAAETNGPLSGGSGFNYSVKIEVQQGGTYTTNIDIPNMDYFDKAGPQFLVVTSAPVPQVVDASIRVSTYLGLSSDPNRQIVDRVMDRDAFISFSVGKAMAVDDPRCNGKIDYWLTEKAPTLGRLNDEVATAAPAAMAPYLNQPVCQPWKWSADNDPNHLRQGLPIIVRNGPMINIGELGFIFLANRENDPGMNNPIKHYKWFWSNIDLMHHDEGAYLLDHLTVRSTNVPSRGLVSISTKQEDILKSLLYRSQIGYSTNIAVLDPSDNDIANSINSVVQAILDRQTVSGTNYISFQDIFDGETPPNGSGPGGKVADRFRELGRKAWEKAGNDPDKAGDAIREGAFRNVLDLITFRQNIFTIILAAQVLAPDESTPVAEKRAVATVYRDAYTGNYFVRSFKWLND